ncbi:hypothetical protein ElyMa_000285200 [Elysia marginata]|uniref:Uncharacterized protein n=1 Tax=Elysia marginata TaxID=1093978 RepID=A0AAV4F5Z3_9GAST|nr:hypothetical protein ElyMa_000285200 [Elysia marginata]
MEPEPLLGELESAVKDLKCRKTPGLDNIPGELLKHSGNGGLKWMEIETADGHLHHFVEIITNIRGKKLQEMVRLSQDPECWRQFVRTSCAAANNVPDAAGR